MCFRLAEGSEDATKETSLLVPAALALTASILAVAAWLSLGGASGL